MNISELQVSDYFYMAEKCVKLEEYEVALKYYQAIVAMEPTNKAGIHGISSTTQLLHSRVYQTEAASYQLFEGRLELHWEFLSFLSSNGQQFEFPISSIELLQGSSRSFHFKYEGKNWIFNCQHAKNWGKALKYAKDGLYPHLPNRNYGSLETYVNNHTEEGNELLKYFIDCTHIDCEYAQIILNDILLGTIPNPSTSPIGIPNTPCSASHFPC